MRPSTLANYIVATATDANGNTSEFSAATPVTAASVPMNITSSGNVEIVSWSAAALGFVLETTSRLTPPILWQPVTNGINDNGTLKWYSVTNEPSPSNRFFRLKSE